MKARVKVFLFVMLSHLAVAQTEWVKSFNGKIGTYPVVFNLQQINGEVKGYYYYTSRHEPVYLSGKINAKTGSGTLLHEDMSGEENFVLNFSKGNLKGIWKKAKLSLAINASEVPLAPVSFTSVYSKESKAMFPKVKDGPVADFYASSVWASGNSPSAKAINQAILASFEGKGLNEIGKIFIRDKKGFLADFMSNQADAKSDPTAAYYNRSLEEEVMLFYQSKNHVVLASSVYEFGGGAHGNYASNYINIDLKTNRKIALGQILSPMAQKALPALLVSQFRDKYKVKPKESLKDIGLFENQIKPNSNYYFTEKGIGFVYNPYEIGPFAMGQIEIFVPFNKLPKGSFKSL